MKLKSVLDMLGDFAAYSDSFVSEKVTEELGLANNRIIRAIYDLQNYLMTVHNMLKGSGDLIHGLMVVQRMICGCEIYPEARIGENFEVVHGGGVVISGTAVIGNNCQVYSGVVLGDKNGNSKSPTLGNNVRVFANSVLYGGIIIGSNTVISANSIVSKDVPENSIVYGVNCVQSRK